MRAKWSSWSLRNKLLISHRAHWVSIALQRPVEDATALSPSSMRRQKCDFSFALASKRAYSRYSPTDLVSVLCDWEQEACAIICDFCFSTILLQSLAIASSRLVTIEFDRIRFLLVGHCSPRLAVLLSGLPATCSINLSVSSYWPLQINQNSARLIGWRIFY